jgi:UTP:GlnB (protein PII) uridylyltransferase
MNTRINKPGVYSIRLNKEDLSMVFWLMNRHTVMSIEQIQAMTPAAMIKKLLETMAHMPTKKEN